MNGINVQTLKGFRDFLPADCRKRQYVINRLRSVFESFGFEPLETPALEYEEVLLGKYGEEGDKLMYRFTDNGERRVALRYDQTVPLARVIAQYGSAGSPQVLPMPFKRYQIQPVWRAENTQKGRFREFLQCDIDIVGSDSPSSDAEILALVYEAFKKLGLDVVIKINDRDLLTQISTKSLTALDKLNKIGEEGVIRELTQNGLGFNEAKDLLLQAKSFQKSIRLREILDKYEEMGYSKYSWKFEPTLVRGLSYYTGMILEVVLKSNSKSLSLGGGGRYDKLIGMFAGREIPAVGFAFGFDRLIEAMDQLDLFPKDLTTTQVLVTIFSKELTSDAIDVADRTRLRGINTEIWLDPEAKLEKQLKYADSKGIPYAIIIGPEEAASEKVVIKDLKTRTQETLTLDEAIQKLTQ